MKNIIIKLNIKLFNIFKSSLIRRILFKILLRLDNYSYENTNFILNKYYGIQIGKYSYGCQKIDGSIEPGTKIGKFCSLAPGVRIGGLNHPKNFLTTHPILYNNIYEFNTNYSIKSKPVFIDDDVWIGFNSIILGGVKIEKGAIIGAGSVVTKDVKAYSIVAGNPARVIGYRFNTLSIEKIKEIDWCNWDIEILKQNSLYFFKPLKYIDILIDIDNR